MYLMYYEDAEGKKVYTLQVVLLLGLLPTTMLLAADRGDCRAENISYWAALLIGTPSSVLTRRQVLKGESGMQAAIWPAADAAATTQALTGVLRGWLVANDLACDCIKVCRSDRPSFQVHSLAARCGCACQSAAWSDASGGGIS